MGTDRPFRVAACQYPIEFLASWDAYEGKLRRLAAEAAGNGARLLVFPEYASLELSSLLSDEVRRSLPGQLASLQDLLPRFLALHAALAQEHRVYLLGGSFPARESDGSYRNRAWLFAPDGSSGFQDKVQMTRFERERWGISGGDEVRVFDTGLGTLGVCLCYDSEFPLLARAQTEAGAVVLLVPSCTDTAAGAHRIRIACQARALESQCFVVSAPTVGSAPWSEAVDENVGQAAAYGPPDRDLPEDGVLAEGWWSEPGWVYADLAPALLRRVREDGQVLTHRDWAGQLGAGGRPVRRVAVGR